MSSHHPDAPGSGAPGPRPTAPTNHSRKKRRTSARTRKILLACLIVVVLVPALVFGIAYVRADVPQPSDMRTNQVATIFADNGTTVLSRVVPPNGNRTEIALKDVPQHVRDAVLSAEDRNFYSNPGFSVTGFLRAARDNVLGRDDAGGGSTITQQYVKNVLVGNSRSVSRKFRELVIASKMAREWSKDDILAAYLNTIYFGRGAYGIAAASKAYFNKPVGELDAAEGAVLAAVIRSPSGLDPDSHADALKERWNYVMDGLVDMKAMTKAERDATEFPGAVPANQIPDDNAARGPEGLIRTQVLNEMKAAGITDEQIDTGGLQITTTIDPKAQQSAVDAVNNVMEGEDPNLREAVVSIDPHTGGVKGYYGGADGGGLDFAQAPLQTGSSFKVFGLVAALKEGIPLSKMFSSAPLTVNGIDISNVEGESCGTCTIAQALKQSLNTSFYRLTLSMENGPNKIATAAHEAGIPETIPGLPGKTLAQPDGNSEAGIVLGQYQVRPIDMASAYATLAASGIYHKPYFVSKVVDSEGEVLLNHKPGPGERRLEAAVADNVTQAMKPIASYSRGHALADGRPSAAKTGTAQLGDTGKNKDAWMVGYTPSLSTAVWMGSEQAQSITNSYGGLIYGSGLPSDIWKKTMDGALDGTDNEDFPWPDPIGGQAGVPSYSTEETGSRSSSNSGQYSNSGGSQQSGGGGGGGNAEAPAQQAPVQQQQQQQEEQAPNAPAAPREIEILPGVTIPLPR